MKTDFGLFEAYGIELEYMIVNKENLNISSIADQILKTPSGEFASDFEDGAITWSNELVSHVIELKTSGPSPRLAQLESEFHRSLQKINHRLSEFGAVLLPTAMHPWMDPFKETKLWAHDNNEIYDAYNRIFDCRGHGWSNLQSMHINLPFKNDDEFFRLHTAIRFLLPIMPALTASSPVMDGQSTGIKDNRLQCYQKNQKRVPSIAGQVIPEAIRSKADYEQKILAKIYSDIEKFDPEEILRDDWLNSRGAIARFERQTIEIRVLDTQECPKVDLAVADFICSVLKTLVDGTLVPIETQFSFKTEELKAMFDLVVIDGENASLSHAAYLTSFNLQGSTACKIIWLALIENAAVTDKMSSDHVATVRTLLQIGSLATRIQNQLGPEPSREKLKGVYSSLATCLATNSVYRP